MSIKIEKTLIVGSIDKPYLIIFIRFGSQVLGILFFYLILVWGYKDTCK